MKTISLAALVAVLAMPALAQQAGDWTIGLGVGSVTTGGGVDGLGGVPTVPAPAGTTPDQTRQDQQAALSGGRTGQLAADFNYNNRIEFSTLETQQALAGLDLANRRAGAYPRLVATAAYGFSG